MDFDVEVTETSWQVRNREDGKLVMQGTKGEVEDFLDWCENHEEAHH